MKQLNDEQYNSRENQNRDNSIIGYKPVDTTRNREEMDKALQFGVRNTKQEISEVADALWADYEKMNEDAAYRESLPLLGDEQKEN